MWALEPPLPFGSRLVESYTVVGPYTMGKSSGDSFIKLAYDLSRAYVDSFIKRAYLCTHAPSDFPSPVQVFSSTSAASPPCVQVLSHASRRQRDMPRRGSHADRLLPVASCLLTFALALSVRMFWALPPETEPVAAPMKYSAEAYWDDELLARCTRHPSPAPRHSRTLFLLGRRWTMTRQLLRLRQRRGSPPRPQRRAKGTPCRATSFGDLESAR